ncbi:fumarylacetoacetate hydrolase family protein [Candidatus Bathyarchaeota archaeon]|nr:fumarylacetoacetate hydrolase family protein [Candidatus Bathyarchaeota archaeon]
MRLLTFKRGGYLGLGCLLGGEVLDLNRAFERHLGDSFKDIEGPFNLDMLSLLDLGSRGLEEARKALSGAEALKRGGEAQRLYEEEVLLKLEEVEVKAPIPRPRKNIVCLGLNYVEHVEEARKRRGGSDLSLPEVPVFFTKAPTSVIGPYDDVIYPRATSQLDYEVELALVLGRRGKYISRGEAYDYIAGYMVFNDVTARDLQRRHRQWFRGKSLDTFSPMGPYIVTSDEIADPMNLEMGLKVNGETRQRSNTGNMIFKPPEILEVLSAGMTLEPGDVIATGTPSGVGMARGPEGLLKPGDVVEAWIEGIGALRNRVVAER